MLNMVVLAILDLIYSRVLFFFLSYLSNTLSTLHMIGAFTETDLFTFQNISMRPVI